MIPSSVQTPTRQAHIATWIADMLRIGNLLWVFIQRVKSSLRYLYLASSMHSNHLGPLLASHSGSFTLVALFVLDVLGDLVETNLLGNSLSSSSVLGTRLVLEDGVDLLEGETLELGQDDSGVDETADTEAHEDNVGLVANVGDHDWGDLGDGKVWKRCQDCSDSAVTLNSLMIQLTADEMDIPLARMSRGKTSADTTQARGPQVTANQTMYQ